MVKGSTSAQLQGGTGGKESLNTLGLVPQSVLHVRWEDESMNGGLFHLTKTVLGNVGMRDH